jgi:beta-phosphoglucomutase-like phosphatase (HAD superfamily)
VLGLPDPVAACLFDLDGVLTQTARLHADAWKEMFDDFLHRRSERTGEPFLPFRLPADYDDFVDGRPAGARNADPPAGRRGDRDPVRAVSIRSA